MTRAEEQYYYDIHIIAIALKEIAEMLKDVKNKEKECKEKKENGI